MNVSRWESIRKSAVDCTLLVGAALILGSCSTTTTAEIPEDVQALADRIAAYRVTKSGPYFTGSGMNEFHESLERVGDDILNARYCQALHELRVYWDGSPYVDWPLQDAALEIRGWILDAVKENPEAFRSHLKSRMKQPKQEEIPELERSATCFGWDK